MEVHVNHQLQETEEGTTLSELLHTLGFEGSGGLAIAINDQVVSKAAWDSYALNPHDHITIIRATQGG
jgi:sulfur carrier protein